MDKSFLVIAFGAFWVWAAAWAVFWLWISNRHADKGQWLKADNAINRALLPVSVFFFVAYFIVRNVRRLFRKVFRRGPH